MTNTCCPAVRPGSLCDGNWPPGWNPHRRICKPPGASPILSRCCSLPIAAALAAEASPLRFKLRAAGSFVTHAEQSEFERLQALPEFAGALQHLGFVAGAEKDRALREADLFCFPTVYLGENQPVNLIEAMAYGLPILTTRWRSLPEMFPPGYPGLVDDQAPDKVANALRHLMNLGDGRELRHHFHSHFTLELHLKKLAAAMHGLETPATGVSLPHSVPAQPLA